MLNKYSTTQKINNYLKTLRNPTWCLLNGVSIESLHRYEKSNIYKKLQSSAGLAGYKPPFNYSEFDVKDGAFFVYYPVGL